MNVKPLLLTAVCCLFTLTSSAQETGRVGRESVQDSVSAHRPYDWSSETRQETAKEYIRRLAQEKTEARRARIEGYRAMGYSPLRPTQSATPFMSHPPTWSVTHVCSPFGTFWVYPGRF